MVVLLVRQVGDCFELSIRMNKVNYGNIFDPMSAMKSPYDFIDGPISCLDAGRPEMAALNSGSLNYLRLVYA